MYSSGGLWNAKITRWNIPSNYWATVDNNLISISIKRDLYITGSWFNTTSDTYLPMNTLVEENFCTRAIPLWTNNTLVASSDGFINLFRTVSSSWNTILPSKSIAIGRDYSASRPESVGNILNFIKNNHIYYKFVTLEKGFTNRSASYPTLSSVSTFSANILGGSELIQYNSGRGLFSMLPSINILHAFLGIRGVNRTNGVMFSKYIPVKLHYLYFTDNNTSNPAVSRKYEYLLDHIETCPTWILNDTGIIDTEFWNIFSYLFDTHSIEKVVDYIQTNFFAITDLYLELKINFTTMENN